MNRIGCVKGLLLLALVSLPVAAQPATHPTTRPIRVAIYQDAGSMTAATNIEKCLKVDPARFSYKRVSAEEIQDGVLKDFDVLVQGGGSGSAQGKALEESGRENIKQFVKSGHGYLGICAGAYLASSDYTWSLHILNAKVLDRAHWNRGGGQVQLALTDAARQQLAIDQPTIECRYNQGPLLSPDTKAELPAYTPLATFASEIALKGAPKGVMIGTTAFARSTFGSGRVFVSSPHPEATPGLDPIVRRAVEWLATGQEAPAP